jgi:predicted nuclease of predicted toxin-antitoxin system
VNLRDFGLLTDENIDPKVVQYLRASGFDVLDAKELGLVGATDDIIVARAAANGRVVVTHDSDFGGRMVTQAVTSPTGLVGIVYLRPGHTDSAFIIGALDVLLSQSIEVTPPFILVVQRSADAIRIRLRQL